MTAMIIDVKELDYKGFHLKRADQGWKIVLNDVEVMFPNFNAASAAIDDFYRIIVKAHQGTKLAIPEEKEGNKL